MIDAQKAGAPQNLLFAPERALIDDYRATPGGIDSDAKVAHALNRDLKKPGKTFTYVVLRGVHFQYRDHYPRGMIPADSPVARQYDTALAWSKRDFFARLLAGIDRDAVAIVYTSDHGQNLTPGALPHCSREAHPDEFRVPLIAFLPPQLASPAPKRTMPHFEDHQMPAGYIPEVTAALLRPLLMQWLDDNMHRAFTKALHVEVAESAKDDKSSY